MAHRWPGRWLGVVAVGAVVLLAGCGRPAGTDGNLTNGWPALPAAQVHVPRVGDCYDGKSDLRALDCAGPHLREVAYVGTFTGSAASLGIPPRADGAEARAAWTACGPPVTSYLGGDWHDGWFLADLVLPTSSSWTGGARWYRCDVAVVSSIYGEARSSARGTLRDAVHARAELALTCLDQDVSADGKSYTGDPRPVACDKPHRGEYVGTALPPERAFPDPDGPTDPRTGYDPASALVYRYCVDKLFAYVGSRTPSDKIGWFYSGFDQDRWDYGDRSARCFVGPINNGSGRFTGSVKGIGTRTPPG